MKRRTLASLAVLLCMTASMYLLSWDRGKNLMPGVQASGTSLWNRTWGGLEVDYAKGVATSSDGIYVVGTTLSFGAVGEDAFITKYDLNGEVIWHRVYGGMNRDYGFGVDASTDGVYMVGSTQSSGAEGGDAFIIKFDGAGNEFWERTIGGFGYDAGWGVAAAADGVYMAMTGLASIVKYDLAGNPLWNVSCGPAVDVDAAADGIYVALGGSFGPSTVAAVKLDGAGNWLWNYTNGNGACAIEVAPDGVYLGGTGPGGNDAMITKLDTDGNELWACTYDMYADGGYDVAVAIDGVYLTGFTLGVDNNVDALLVKYGFSGDPLWNRTWGGPGSEWGNGVAITPDGLIMVGETQSFGSGFNVVDNAFIVKYDASGNTAAMPIVTAYLLIAIVLIVIAITTSCIIVIAVLQRKKHYKRMLAGEVPVKGPIRSQDKETLRMNRVKAMFRIADRVKIDDLADLLNMQHDDLLKLLSGWSSVIAFEISGDELVISSQESIKLLEEIDGYFSKWAEKGEKKLDKI
ncbi:MAG: hypothetical protein GYA24_06495 [Candidatus Lokiarchaeota archaeon]|nr:hypothetical protein [Candidatus Lokiarchaeota archaeon]